MTSFKTKLVCRETQIEADSVVVDGMHHKILCVPCEFALDGESAQSMYDKQSDFFLGKKTAVLVRAATARFPEVEPLSDFPAQTADPGGHFILVETT